MDKKSKLQKRLRKLTKKAGKKAARKALKKELKRISNAKDDKVDRRDVKPESDRLP